MPGSVRIHPSAMNCLILNALLRLRRFPVITGTPYCHLWEGSSVPRLFRPQKWLLRKVLGWGGHRTAESAVPPRGVTEPNLLRMLTKVIPFFIKQSLFFDIILVKCFIFIAILNFSKEYWSQARQVYRHWCFKQAKNSHPHATIFLKKTQKTLNLSDPFTYLL